MVASGLRLGRVRPPLGELLERDTRLHALVGHLRQCKSPSNSSRGGSSAGPSGGGESGRGEVQRRARPHSVASRVPFFFENCP